MDYGSLGFWIWMWNIGCEFYFCLNLSVSVNFGFYHYSWHGVPIAFGVCMKWSVCNCIWIHGKAQQECTIGQGVLDTNNIPTGEYSDYFQCHQWGSLLRPSNIWLAGNTSLKLYTYHWNNWLLPQDEHCCSFQDKFPLGHEAWYVIHRHYLYAKFCLKINTGQST